MNFARLVGSLFCISTGAVAFTNSYFGYGLDPVHIDNVHCLGNENRLFNCNYNDQPQCSKSSLAGVRCRGI